jgi:hypothetical protein
LINFKLYGVSQNPITKSYFLVFQDYCIKCNKNYTNVGSKWCKPCQIKDLKENSTNWTSGNIKIDNFIQERKLEICNPLDIIFEWISYDQFFDIKEIDNDDFSIIYSAKWKDGPLYWDKYNKKYSRSLNSKVLLKYLYNLRDIDEFLNEVCN